MEIAVLSNMAQSTAIIAFRRAADRESMVAAIERIASLFPRCGQCWLIGASKRDIAVHVNVRACRRTARERKREWQVDRGARSVGAPPGAARGFPSHGVAGVFPNEGAGSHGVSSRTVRSERLRGSFEIEIVGR